jgi:hypothetical protein
MPLDKKRSRLADYIDREGVEMFPCSNCMKHKRPCVCSDTSSSKRCGECVRRGIKCDVEGIPVSDWDTLDREEYRLETAEMVAEESLRKAQEQMNLALNRLARLKKQKRFLRERGKDMLTRGLKTLDELDEAEEKEKQEKEKAAAEAARLSSVVPGPETVSEDLFAFLADPSLSWVPLETTDETPQVSRGS